MATKREQIMEALKTKLDTISGLPCFRSRKASFARSKLPAVVLEPSKEAADNTMISFLEWELIFIATLLVRDDSADSAADPYMDSIHAKIMEDITLGGLSLEILPFGTEYFFETADSTAAAIAMSYRVKYRTSVTNLSS
jgi:hypothetical protein